MLQLWLVALLFGGALYLFPVSTRLTRLAGLCWLAVVWFGFIALVWRWWMPRLVVVGATLLLAVVLQTSARDARDGAALRQEYVRCWRRYEGCRYYWGGETRREID